jgi:hypothetical protein
MEMSEEEVQALVAENTRLKASVKELEDWRNALEAAGVDNWDGYEYAKEILRGDAE